MSSLRNSTSRRAHKERSQPQSRAKFGLLEKHKDYVVRAKAYHQKEETLRKLKEKAAFRNPDEFNFKMVHAKLVDGVHTPTNEGNKYTQEELMLMKTQDIGYILHKWQSEKKKIEKLNCSLQFLDNRSSKKLSKAVPDNIKRELTASYKELEAKKKRANTLERLYNEMSSKKEVQKKGKKRKLREDEMVYQTSRPMYRWSYERKR